MKQLGAEMDQLTTSVQSMEAMMKSFMESQGAQRTVPFGPPARETAREDGRGAITPSGSVLGELRAELGERHLSQDGAVQEQSLTVQIAAAAATAAARELRKRGGRDSGSERDSEDEMPKSRSRGRGSERRAALKREHAAYPAARYRHVMSVMRSAGRSGTDAVVANKFLRKNTTIGKFATASRLATLLNKIHGCLTENDVETAKWWIATSYMFLEQMAIDGGTLTTAWLHTFEPSFDEQSWRRDARSRAQPEVRLGGACGEATGGCHEGRGGGLREGARGDEEAHRRTRCGGDARLGCGPWQGRGEVSCVRGARGGPAVEQEATAGGSPAAEQKAAAGPGTDHEHVAGSGAIVELLCSAVQGHSFLGHFLRTALLQACGASVLQTLPHVYRYSYTLSHGSQLVAPRPAPPGQVAFHSRARCGFYGVTVGIPTVSPREGAGLCPPRKPRSYASCGRWAQWREDLRSCPGFGVQLFLRSAGGRRAAGEASGGFADQGSQLGSAEGTSAFLSGAFLRRPHACGVPQPRRVLATRPASGSPRAHPRFASRARQHPHTHGRPRYDRTGTACVCSYRSARRVLRSGGVR